MPEFNLAANKLLRTTIRQKYNETDDVIWTGWYATTTIAPVGQTSAQFLSTLRVDWLADVYSQVCDIMVTRSFHCVEYDVATGEIGRYDDNYNELSGSRDVPALPPSDALVVRRQTGEANRRSRGRWYCAGMPASSQTNGVFQGADWDTARLSLTAFTSRVVEDGDGNRLGAPVMPRRKRPGDQGPTFSPLILTGATADSIVRTQRRRQIGRGS